MLHHELEELQQIQQRKAQFFCTVADLRQVKLGEVPPLQAVSGVCDVAGDCRLAVPDRCTWEDRHVGFTPQKNNEFHLIC